MDPFRPVLEYAPGYRPVRVASADLVGVDARLVEIEASASGSTNAGARIIGLPDAAVREALDRVQMAFDSYQLAFPRGKLVINLAPARARKAGSGFDVGIACTIACLEGLLPRTSLEGLLAIGELGLDGSVRPVPGLLSTVALAKETGAKRMLCPDAQASLAQAFAGEGLQILPAKDLKEAFHLCRDPSLSRDIPELPREEHSDHTCPDISRVRGQEDAVFALRVAAAGGHNLLMIGPPGCGKTLLASCLPGILPDLIEQQRFEVLRVHSACHSLLPEHALEILTRGTVPLRAPHHTISYAGLVGGGQPARPGEITLAHRGILFLDELPEFRRECLEALRQPLEAGHIHLRRAQFDLDFPARFQLIAAMNPCPCGMLGHPKRPCRDTPLQVQRYQARVSGPLLDRIDMGLRLQPVAVEDVLSDDRAGDLRSPVIREEIRAVRALQRLRNDGRLNADLEERELRTGDQLGPKARRLLIRSCRSGRLSARAITRTLRVARTIADLQGSETVREEDLACALHYRRHEFSEDSEARV